LIGAARVAFDSLEEIQLHSTLVKSNSSRKSPFQFDQEIPSFPKLIFTVISQIDSQFATLWRTLEGTLFLYWKNPKQIQ